MNTQKRINIKKQILAAFADENLRERLANKLAEAVQAYQWLREDAYGEMPDDIDNTEDAHEFNECKDFAEHILNTDATHRIYDFLYEVWANVNHEDLA